MHAVVPASHKPGYVSGFAEAEVTSATATTRPEVVHAVGKAGDVLIFDARLYHSIAPNTSLHPRIYVKLRYAPGWMSNGCISRIGGHNAGWDPLPTKTWEALSPIAKPHFVHAWEWDGKV